MAKSLAIIGLGYVGLPLAVAFDKRHNVIGFDINSTRIFELQNSIDTTNEVSHTDLTSCNIKFTSDEQDLQGANIYIVTVPTPVDEHKVPDLTPLRNASNLISRVINKHDIVIFESTVYPGVTENVCGKIISEKTGLKINEDFLLGYSPERINPGDKEHTITNIPKVVSLSDNSKIELIHDLYSSVISAQVYCAESIKVAEAAKVIENIQRDVNIALINEFYQLFDQMDINTYDVLNAASTKWNFLNFKPGIVGGHCIGVDPYYLLHAASSIGFHSELIFAGRRVNDSMPRYIAKQFIKKLISNVIDVSKAEILIIGGTFKENCPDIRNSKTPDVIKELQEYGIKCDVYDPLMNNEEFLSEYDIEALEKIQKNYDGIMLLVPHNQIVAEFDAIIASHASKEFVLYDLKNALIDTQ